MRNVLIVLCTVMLIRSVWAQDPHFQDSLTLARATEIALRYHPSIRAAEAALRSASAGLTGAKSTYYPQISATASATRTDGAFVFNPDFPPRNQTYNNYLSGLAVNQMLFDFGRTINRVSANSDLTRAAEQDYYVARETSVQNVQVLYYGLVQAADIVHVNEEAVARAEQHLKQAQAFYSVGRKAQFDVTKSDVDLANARVGLLTARNQESLARLQLENAMGVRAKRPYRLTDSLAIPPFDLPLDTVQSRTLQHRPDLLAAQARVEASREFASAAWDQNLPTLSASGTWNWSAFDFPLFPRATYGVTLSLPIFQGFSVSAQAEQASAVAAQAEATYDIMLQSVRNEAEQNYLGLTQARERINASQKLAEQAGQNLTLAERQYAAGVSSLLDVTDAQLTLSNARIIGILALFDYNTSLIRLRRSMGALTK